MSHPSCLTSQLLATLAHTLHHAHQMDAEILDHRGVLRVDAEVLGKSIITRS